MNQLVSIEWLHENISHPDLIILDSSPTATITGDESEIKDLCIPQARIFNIKKHFTNKESKFPNTIPTEQQFETECQKLGINNESIIVVYDNLGIYTSPRVWWLFKTMGHDKVAVLNGGLPAWLEKGGASQMKSKIIEDYPIGNFKADFNNEYILSYKDIVENISSKEYSLIDARSSGRFNGTAPEPRKHLQSGHIENSINIPYNSLFENGKFKEIIELRKIFESKKTANKKLAFTCGSGMTACIVMLASEIAFKESRFLYDGSWSEYAELEELTIDLE